MMQSGNSYRWRKQLLILCGFLIAYVGSFFCCRLTAYRFSLFPPDSPQQYVVIFSWDTESHEKLRLFYRPLIHTIPGRCAFPNREQHTLLVEHARFVEEISED